MSRKRFTSETRTVPSVGMGCLFLALALLLALLPVSCSDDDGVAGPGDGDGTLSPHPDAVAWDHPDGTTHWYLPVAVSVHSTGSVPSGTAPQLGALALRGGGITWSAAHDSAASLGGYLATATSVEENDQIFSLIDAESYWIQKPGGALLGPWIGGHQINHATEPAGGWEWISGESFDYTAWCDGQPDEGGPLKQNRIHFGVAAGSRLNAWNDLNETEALAGFVVEFSDNQSARTMGLFHCGDGVHDGYTLFAPQQYTDTYLIDLDGQLVHHWSSDYLPGNSAYLLEGGHLLRTATFDPAGSGPFAGGGAGGRIEDFDWDGNLIWAFELATDSQLLHHDIEKLPNGNVLAIAWEYKTEAEATAAGRLPGTLRQGALWPDCILEIAPTGSFGGAVVWEWHVWDHLVQDADPELPNYGVVAEHPERININYDPEERGQADWNHTNGIDYNAALDQIVVSVRQFSEFWVIDHTTTTAEAAGSSGGRYGRGGDLLYRWGNPEAYGAGDTGDRQLYVQHDAHWIPSGYPGGDDILVFNNGEGRSGTNYSSVDQVTPPLTIAGDYACTGGSAYGPAASTWSYVADPPQDFYSSFISGAQRLLNGNTLICQGAHGTFFEVTSDGQEVWRYVCPVADDGPLTQGEMIPETGNGLANAVFRAYRYCADGPELVGRDLTPQGTIEQSR